MINDIYNENYKYMNVGVCMCIIYLNICGKYRLIDCLVLYGVCGCRYIGCMCCVFYIKF